MLFKQRILDGIADGSVTLAIRRWGTPRVQPGSRIVTTIGVVEIISVEPVADNEIGSGDAERAGYPNVETLLKDVNAFSKEGGLFRVGLSRIGDDPRIELREQDELDESELEAIRGKLARLDRASSAGPWTRMFLRLIRTCPGRRAGELSEASGWEKEKLKLNVRKLKNLGLTISLGTGYKLSPRGESYLQLLNRETTGR